LEEPKKGLRDLEDEKEDIKTPVSKNKK